MALEFREGMTLYIIQQWRGGDGIVPLTMKKKNNAWGLEDPEGWSYGLPTPEKVEESLGWYFFLSREDALAYVEKEAEEYKAKISTKESLLQMLYRHAVDEHWSLPQIQVLKDRIQEEFGVTVT